jgi:hypothetical protein
LEISAQDGCQLCQVLFRYGTLPASHSRDQDSHIDEDENLEQIYYETCGYYHFSPSTQNMGLRDIQFYMHMSPLPDKAKLYPWLPSSNRRNMLYLGLFAEPGNTRIDSCTFYAF